MTPTTVYPNVDLGVTPPPARDLKPPRDPGSEDPRTERFPAAPGGPNTPPRGVAVAPASSHGFSVSDYSDSLWGSDPIDLPGRRAPRIGDTFLGFKLVAELGRGAFARVYRAEQEGLSNRPVALKITLRPTREAERLAKLQHANIVPVYSVHNDDPVQVICMPYLGRTTISDLIRAYRSEHSARSSRRRSTVRAGQRTTFVNSTSRARSDGTSVARPMVWTYGDGEPPPVIGDPEEVLRVLARLAAGLSHAHERGILHLDLKPANVLLADTGEPMLLDFNLSFDANSPDRDHVGGTVPYMAIEQLLEMRERQQTGSKSGSRPVNTTVIDARTDLYSLGVMAYEMLTGVTPFPGTARDLLAVEVMITARRKGPPPIRERNPLVTPIVEAIVAKLLAPEPKDRYQTAEELRIDIERHLHNQPLIYAREPMGWERFTKWRRRNPGLPVRLAAAGLIGLVLGLGGIAHERAAANATAQAVEKARATRAGLDPTRLDLILPDDTPYRARGQKRATELLAGYGLPDDPNWQQRPEVKRLPASERAALAEDLGELLILLAESKWQDAAGRPEAERRAVAAEAWKLNAAARTCYPEGGAPAVLDRQAATLAPAAGAQFHAAAVSDQKPTPRAEFLDAVFALRSGQYLAAVPVLERVTAAQPGHPAAQFCLAFCQHKLARYVQATERYDVARVLLRNDPRPAYYRGLAFVTTRKYPAAEKEFEQAIDLDPQFAEAYRQRALTRYRLAWTARHDPKQRELVAKKYEEAEADLDAALERGSPPLFVHLLRSRVRDARGNKAGAQADRDAADRITPVTEADFLVRGTVRRDIDPKAALDDYRKAAELNPRSLVALQNQAHVLADKLKDNPAALVVATRVAELYPEFAPAVAGRAVVLARLGKREEAIREIEKARLLSDDPEIIYQTACVYSLLSKDSPEYRTKSVELLRQAYREGYADVTGLATDPDLELVRGEPEFRELRRAANTFAK